MNLTRPKRRNLKSLGTQRVGTPFEGESVHVELLADDNYTDIIIDVVTRGTTTEITLFAQKEHLVIEANLLLRALQYAVDETLK